MCISEVEDVTKWSSRMREPFVKLYGMEYFQTQWSNWVNAYGQYMEQRKGGVQGLLLLWYSSD